MSFLFISLLGSAISQYLLFAEREYPKSILAFVGLQVGLFAIGSIALMYLVAIGFFWAVHTFSKAFLKP